MAEAAVDVLVIVDQKWRDLPAMAALAVCLEDGFGRSTALVPFTMWRYSLLTLRPQAVAVTHMNGPRSLAIAQLARRMGTRVVVIPTEGRPGNAEAMDYGFGAGAELHAADLWFTWSETVRQYMIDKGLPPDRVVVGGVPRFDIYREPLGALRMPRDVFAARFGLDPRRPIVTWATNFTHAKFYRRNEAFLLKDWTDLGLLKYRMYSQPLDFARFDHEARERSLDAMRTLLRARPDVQVALKPHPHEEHERYRAYVDECRRDFGPRIALVTSVYISDLLNASSVHVHRMCMTGAESWLLDLPSIELHLLDYQSMSLRVPGATSEAVAGSDLVETADALVAAVDRYLAGGRPSTAQVTARDGYIRKWLFSVDGQRCMAHAAAIAGLIAERRAVRMPAFDWRAWRTVGAIRVKQLLGRPAHAPLTLRPYRADRADTLGHVDNFIAQADVDGWRARCRDALRDRIAAGFGAGVPAAASIPCVR